jgi:hypothetical protein
VKFKMGLVDKRLEADNFERFEKHGENTADRSI